MSLADTLGFQQLLLERDHAVLRTMVGAGHTNMHGTGHGGFVYALADEAFAREAARVEEALAAAGVIG